MLDISIPGLPEQIAALGRLSDALLNELAGVLETQADLIMSESKENYVPVRDGELMRGGMVMDAEISGDVVDVALAYGTNTSKAYAWHWHEYPDCGCPDTSADINWSKPGTGPKYLEIPFLAQQATLSAEVNAAMQAALVRAGVAK